MESSKEANFVFKCEICSNVYRYKESLKSHMKNVHEKVRKFICKICDQSFYASSKLQDHISRNHETTEMENLKCHKCEKTFSNQPSLKSHLRDVHSQNSIKCDTCGKSFTRNSSLKLHMSIVHENLKKTI